jgi:hypothetical protein
MHVKTTSHAALLALFVAASSMGGVDGTAWARETADAQPNHVRLGGGLYVPAGDLADRGYDPGGDFSLFFGRRLGRYLLVDGGLGFSYSQTDTGGNAPSAGLYYVGYGVGLLSSSASVKAVYPVGRLEVFGGAGVGAYVVALHADVASNAIGDARIDHREVAFGGHVVVGLDVDVTDRLFVGGEARYLWTSKVDVRDHVSDVPVRLQGNMNGAFVDLVVGLRF